MIIKYLYTTLYFFILVFLLSSCKEKASSGRMVTVSILPQKYFVERIAGDYVNVNVMISPGMNPVTCDFNSTQLKNLYDSDICFAIGNLPFETTHLYPALDGRQIPLLIRHTDSLQLLKTTDTHSHGEGHIHAAETDPHIWLSPRYALLISRQILNTLSRKYTELQSTFEQNYKQLERDICNLAQEADSSLIHNPCKTFLIYHPALTYFAQDYGLEQISIEDEGKEPNPVHLKKIIDLAKEKDIHLVFIQHQFDASNAQAIAQAIQGEVVQIDPLNENWLEEMKSLIQKLRKGNSKNYRP